MQKLVMHYSHGDGCTYHCDYNIPFLYISAEQAMVDFETLAKTKQRFTWANKEFYSCDFFHNNEYYSPEFFTLNEWWGKFGQ